MSDLLNAGCFILVNFKKKLPQSKLSDKSSKLYLILLYFPGGSDDKESACHVGDLGSIPGLGRSPGEGNGYSLQLFLPGKFHGQRSLVGYSPQGHKESDTTERLT